MFYSQKYNLSKNLSLFIQEYLCLEDKTNKRLAKSIKDKYITDNALIPGAIVELGFMSNPQEDKLMETEEYQDKMVNGIVSGLEKYFAN